MFAGLGSDRYFPELGCITKIPIMRDVLRICDCSIAPMQSGSGDPRQDLEALGAGIPCIASKATYSVLFSLWRCARCYDVYRRAGRTNRRCAFWQIKPNRNEVVAKLSLEANADRIYESLFSSILAHSGCFLFINISRWA